MAHHMVWWRLVGAVPVCPPVSPHKGASIVQFPAHNACILGMETPLRGRSGGHTGNRFYAMTKFRINRMARMRSVMLSRLYCAVQSFKMT